MEWLKAGLGPLEKLISFLQKKADTNDVQKKQVLRELQQNLNVFKNGYLNSFGDDTLIVHLSNEAIKAAVVANFSFAKLKAGKIEPYHITDERNRRYQGWTIEQLFDKIDEKIEEMKTLQKMNGGSVANLRNNTSLTLSNLYYRLKLAAEFIRSDVK
ncbi:hypothetical protein [Flavihumibacter solisilvae]|jgi:hypothetical protein|uniref:Uncharacterized protein n=1 Tax=Flavihumibacter solisilvae TaxID=1349421 RepID=A0A0C1LIX4_9BACT|nr:hypothetical protein [Flavihumibacter solisilvae]KIC95343.1 hypothetical protein OI18_07020 [Flavihumibacter solisilvae]